MKTTVEINDDLFREVKELAQRHGVPLRTIIESALRHEISRHAEPRRFTLRDATFSGNGLQPPIRDGDWTSMRDLSYDGRGG